MKHPLIINSNGKAQKEVSFFSKTFTLSALGDLIAQHPLMATKYFISEADWDDIVKCGKE